MKVIDICEAEAQFYKIIDLVAQGKEFIIEKNDNPLAVLSPIKKSKKKRKGGHWKGLVKMSDDFNGPL